MKLIEYAIVNTTTLSQNLLIPVHSKNTMSANLAPWCYNILFYILFAFHNNSHPFLHFTFSFVFYIPFTFYILFIFYIIFNLIALH